MLLSVISERREPGITVITITGRIALGVERGQIEGAVVEALDQGIRNIVVDLGHVSYIDSTGMGIIALCFAKASKAGAQLSVASLNGRVMDVFRIVRLDQAVAFFPDAETACAACASTISTS